MGRRDEGLAAGRAEAGQVAHLATISAPCNHAFPMHLVDVCKDLSTGLGSVSIDLGAWCSSLRACA